MGSSSGNTTDPQDVWYLWWALLLIGGLGGRCVLTQLPPKSSDVCSGPEIKCKNSGVLMIVGAGVNDVGVDAVW